MIPVLTLACYLPLHQPSGVRWLYHVLPFLPWFSFSGTPCLGHCGAVSAVGPLWVCSQVAAASTCALTLAKSVPRNVTMTSWPLSVAFSVIDTGASGSGTTGVSGCVGWLAASALQPAAAADVVRVGEGPFITGGGFYVANDRGYFKKMGLGSRDVPDCRK